MPTKISEEKTPRKCVDILLGLEFSSAIKNGRFKKRSSTGSASQDSGKSFTECYNL